MGRDGWSVQPAALVAVARAYRRSERRRRNFRLDNSGPIVVDPEMQRIYQLLERVAHSALPVLILGETGTGKEVLAHWLHSRSARRDNPLIKINCAGLTESVVESELFGHERGAFTGAIATHRGVFEAADSGSLFLDEIGELSLRTQAKLLRALELGEFTRVGSTQMRRVDVRFIAANHRDVTQLVERGEFRSDLFYRLNGISVEVQQRMPLRAARLHALVARDLGGCAARRRHRRSR